MTYVDPWPAPRARGPVDATVSLPGSKSLTNRALVLAAIADGPSVVRRALRSRDTSLMATALTSLGAQVDTTGDDWAVTPGAFDRDADGRLRAGRDGAEVRAAGRGPVERVGRLRRRPAHAHPPGRRGAHRAARPRRDRRRRRPRRAAVHRARRRRGAGRAGRDRRVGVLAVRLGPPAGGRQVRQGRRRPPRRQARAVDAAHRDDGLAAAPPRRRGRRRGAQPLAGRPRAGHGAGHRDRARPLQRRAVPGPGRGDRRFGDRARLAARDDPARRRPARPAGADGLRGRPDRRGPDGHRSPVPGRASTPTSTTSAS